MMPLRFTCVLVFLSDAGSNVGLTISILVMKSLLLIISLEALDDAAHIRLKHFGYIIISANLFRPSFTRPRGSFFNLLYFLKDCYLNMFKYFLPPFVTNVCFESSKYSHPVSVRRSFQSEGKL